MQLGELEGIAEHFMIRVRFLSLSLRTISRHDSHDATRSLEGAMAMAMAKADCFGDHGIGRSKHTWNGSLKLEARKRRTIETIIGVLSIS